MIGQADVPAAVCTIFVGIHEVCPRDVPQMRRDTGPVPGQHLLSFLPTLFTNRNPKVGEYERKVKHLYLPHGFLQSPYQKN